MRLIVLCTLACAPAQDRVLRVNDAAIGELDPHKATDYADSILMFNIYDFLVRPTPDGQLEPDLATSWTVSDDGQLYTFTLRSDATFHDGTPVKAEDVVFSVQRFLTMQRGFSFLFADLDSVEATGPHHIKFYLKKPFAPFIASLARFAIVNSKLVSANLQNGDFGEYGDYGDLFLSTHDGGSGSYRVVSHDPRSLTVLQQFENHYRPFALKAPKGVRLKYSIEAPTIRALMRRREHDITRMSLPPEILRSLATNPGIVLAQDRRASVFCMKFNTQRAPTDDVHFRRAMALAFDYDAMHKLLKVDEGFSNGVPARGPLPVGLIGYDETIPYPTRDLAAAQAELSKSAYAPDDHVIEIQWVSEVALSGQIALLFQQNMLDLGINVRVIRSPWALVLERATSPQTTPHVNNVDVSAYTTDPDSLLSAMFHSSNLGNWTSMEWLDDPDIDRGIEIGRAMLRPPMREQHYRNLVHRIMALQPAIFAYETTSVIAKQDYIRAPTLEDPKRAIRTTGANYVFRDFEYLR
jgi:peptide/nickel transport system substrate-binding protein